MNQKLLITNLEKNQKAYTATALYEEDRLLELNLEPCGGNSLLGNIYVGRVKDVVKNLNAAFIEIAPGLACYYSLEDYVNPVFVKKINSPRLVQGDELLVQVVKEPMKTKPPRVTSNLNFPGKYLALTTENKRLGVSKKLDPKLRSHYQSLLEPHMDGSFGLVVRTNSKEAGDARLLEELERLKNQAMGLIEKARYRTCFSCLQKQQEDYLNYLQNVSSLKLDQILTDDGELYEKIHAFLEERQPEDIGRLRLYQDPLLPLAKLYSLEAGLDEALKERIWLKSGAYLIIQPTEALTIIDVNTGKNIAKRNPQEHYLKVNLEAAREAARQLRLRNMSGIILIDFIDMADPGDTGRLLEAMRNFTAQDSVPVQVVDMTKLNLMEMTRKKVRRSLSEQLT